MKKGFLPEMKRTGPFRVGHTSSSRRGFPRRGRKGSKALFSISRMSFSIPFQFLILAASAAGGARRGAAPLLPPAASGPLGPGILDRVGKGYNLFQVPVTALLAFQRIPSGPDPFPDLRYEAAALATVFINGHILYLDKIGFPISGPSGCRSLGNSSGSRELQLDGGQSSRTWGRCILPPVQLRASCRPFFLLPRHVPVLVLFQLRARLPQAAPFRLLWAF